MTRFLRPGLALLALGLAACDGADPASQAPAALDFRSDAGAYSWRFADGVLALAPAGPDAGPPAIAIRCVGESRLGLQTRLFRIEPVSPPLQLRVGDLTVEAPARRTMMADQPGLEGEGAIPDGWVEAFAGPARLGLRYGDQGVEVQGPGRALAEDLRRACAAGD